MYSYLTNRRSTSLHAFLFIHLLKIISQTSSSISSSHHISAVKHSSNHHFNYLLFWVSITDDHQYRMDILTDCGRLPTHFYCFEERKSVLLIYARASDRISQLLPNSSLFSLLYDFPIHFFNSFNSSILEFFNWILQSILSTITIFELRISALHYPMTTCMLDLISICSYDNAPLPQIFGPNNRCISL